jgi:hypothetical protein
LFRPQTGSTPTATPDPGVIQRVPELAREEESFKARFGKFISKSKELRDSISRTELEKINQKKRKGVNSFENRSTVHRF